MELHGKGDNACIVHCPLFRCSSSARTVQEASDSEADWQQSTACWEVGSVLRQDRQRGKPERRKLGDTVYGVSVVDVCTPPAFFRS